MSWFDTTGIANLAKSALTTAQKTIDKALDIQEDSNQAGKSSKKKEDTDNFFEAFGLSDKTTSSQPAKQPVPKAKSDSPENITLQQSSNFWSDTWGSFFEMKTQNVSSSESKAEPATKDHKSSENESNKGEAVMSQPHRASPFPGETHHKSDVTNSASNAAGPLAEPSSEENKKNNLSFEDKITDDTNLTECEFSSESAEVDSCKDPARELVTTSSEIELVSAVPTQLEEALQGSNELSCLQESTAVSCDSNENQRYVSDECKTTSICDTLQSLEVETEKKEVEAVICKQPQTIPENELILEQSSVKQLEQSEFYALQVPNPAQSHVPSSVNRKPELEYDVIEMSDANQLSDSVEKSSNSSTRSQSVEVIESISQSLYNISTSTIEIPDIPASVANNIISWDCRTLDKLLPVSFSVEDESQDSNYTEVNQSLSEELSQMISPESSFHTMSASSFTDNQNWGPSNSSSHFINESPNSSNGERNSHHSDGSSNSSKDDDDTDTAEVKECEVKSSSSNGSQGTSSSSFVKCSMEEADSGSHRGQSPASTTASERSDITKQESEQNTSGDENETATSSDIEILSPPNGENGDRNASPLKHMWLPRPLRIRRSESPTSDSSKDSLMPVVSEVDEAYDERDTESPTMHINVTDGARCHKRNDSDESCLEELLQREEELKTILAAREKKILEFSKENMELQENEQRLKNLMQKMREERENESKDITDLTKEFTRRLSHVEEKLCQTMQERDTLQVQLKDAKEELSSRITVTDMEEVISEKDLQIKELTEEGQKLSKKELQHTTIIKKLRAREEEKDRTISSQSGKIEENSKEVDRLRKSISAKEDQEKKHIEAIRQLTSSVKKQEKEIENLKSNLEDSKEKEQTLKKSLDSTYMDLLVIRKSQEMKEKEIEDLKSGLEIEANENLQMKLENLTKDTTKEKENLIMQMQELRGSITRTEQEYNMREKMFKADIASLQQRLQEAEERNEDLTKNMSMASRPLVRQIENLQATYNSQTSSWEKVEKNLTDRLNDVQTQLALCSERERSATEKYLDLSSKVIAYESQNSTLRQEKLQLSSELETLKANIMMLEEKNSRETLTIDKIKQSLLFEIKGLKQEKESIESTMATCLEQLEIEKKKVVKLEEEIKFKDARALVNQNISPCPSPTGSFRSSVGSYHNWSQDEIQEKGSTTPINSYRISVYDSLRLGSGSSLLENLQSQLKQREGEIVQLQSEISKLEKDKELMAQELVELSEQNEDLQIKLDKLEAIEKEHKDLNQKYNTLLQMYGEKVEETEELHLDLADVKSMYKAQIEELLRSK